MDFLHTTPYMHCFASFRTSRSIFLDAVSDTNRRTVRTNTKHEKLQLCRFTRMSAGILSRCGARTIPLFFCVRRWITLLRFVYEPLLSDFNRGFPCFHASPVHDGVVVRVRRAHDSVRHGRRHHARFFFRAVGRREKRVCFCENEKCQSRVYCVGRFMHSAQTVGRNRAGQCTCAVCRKLPFND